MFIQYYLTTAFKKKIVIDFFDTLTNRLVLYKIVVLDVEHKAILLDRDPVKLHKGLNDFTQRAWVEDEQLF